jgi:hypothetical protein
MANNGMVKFFYCKDCGKRKTYVEFSTQREANDFRADHINKHHNGNKSIGCTGWFDPKKRKRARI